MVKGERRPGRRLVPGREMRRRAKEARIRRLVEGRGITPSSCDQEGKLPSGEICSLFLSEDDCAWAGDKEKRPCRQKER